MDTNTLLRIYQTYSLEKISALSKQSLAAQYAQNEQLVQLNKELAANNAVANKILKNQIQEIERQEKGRFYKNMIFNLKLATDKIENQPLINFRLFLSSLFLKPIEAYAKESITNLEEIKDKEYAQQIIDRVKSISSSNQSYQEEYDKSAWSSYFSAKEAYENYQDLAAINNKKKEIEKIKEEVAKKTKDDIELTKFNKKFSVGCFTFSLLFLLYIVGALIYAYYINDPDASGGIPIVVVAILFFLLACALMKKSGEKQMKEGTQKENKELEQRITHLQVEIEEILAKNKEAENQFNSISSFITAECNEWETQTNEIIELLPHDKKDGGKLDPKLEEAAHIVVNKQDGSTSLVQRKLAIGYNRAERIMNQLELVGVVGATKGTKSRDVLISDEETLEILLSKWR
jgi:two-component sensor histidine kinase